MQAKEVTQQPSVQSQSAPLSLEPTSVVQEISPSQPALTPIQNSPSASTPVVSMQVEASDNQFDSQNQSIPSSNILSGSKEAVVDKHQPSVTEEYIPPLNPPVASMQNSAPQMETQSEILDNAPIPQAEQAIPDPTPLARSISRRAILIGLGVAGVIVAGSGGITWFAVSHKSAITQTPVVTQTLGRLLYTYTGHSAGVNSVAWAPNGQRIASGSNDDTVQVWNAVDGSHVFTYSCLD